MLIGKNALCHYVGEKTRNLVCKFNVCTVWRKYKFLDPTPRSGYLANYQVFELKKADDPFVTISLPMQC